MKTHNAPAAVIQGQLAVHRVVSELIKRGHIPYLPVVDVGVDVLLGTGIRLQVKSTQRPSTHWRFKGAWSFTLSTCQRIVKQEYVTGQARMFSAEVDFVILHAIEANRYWIVPALVLDGRKTVAFRDGIAQWKDIDLAEAQRLRAEGLSYLAIAERLGETDHHTIMRRLKGEQSRYTKRNYANIPSYENRWDLITGALATLREANSVVSSPLSPVRAAVSVTEPSK